MEKLIQELAATTPVANYESNTETIKEGRVMVMITHDQDGENL